MALCSKTTLFAVALILVALVYQRYRSTGNGEPEQASVHRRKEGKKRILIGVNADVDFILSAVDLLSELGAAPGGVADHSSISTVSELQELVAHSMATCSGVERSFSDKKLFDHIVQVAANLTHEEYLGGNAGLMAQQISTTTTDNEVMLVAPIGSRLKKYLHPRIITPPGSSSVKEEVHIIMEYPTGATWGNTTAVCANRVIISHDLANSRLQPLEVFKGVVAGYKPDLVIFSGAHMMEAQPRKYWEKRTKDLVKVLQTIPRHSPVHLEMATVGDQSFVKYLANQVFAHVDSIGLNEQELLILAQSEGADFNFTDIGSKPSIPHACDLLHWMYSTYTSFQQRRKSRLSRIHFHSLTYHLMVNPTRDLAGSRWQGGVTAVMAGSKKASLQACDTDEITPEKFELKIPKRFKLSNTHEILSKKDAEIEYEPENGYVAWQRDSLDYFMSPVYVCRKPLKTVGLGDAISSAGLLNSEFSQAKMRFRKN